MGEWIDFKKLREELPFEAVLTYYGVELKPTPAGQHQGRCPLPLHPKESTSKTFSANLKKKIWRCFVCGGHSSGNLLDFAVVMEGGNPKDPQDVRKVALKLQAVLGGGNPPPPSRRSAAPTPNYVAAKASSVLVNPPLDFTLKNLSTEHAFFHKHRLLRPTIEHFGLGYCTKGMFAGRIAVPLNNRKGELIGYAGRLTDEFEVAPSQPLYLWPTERERSGVKHVFDRTAFLYHVHRIMPPVTDLVVVQGFESAWWVWQAGFHDVVAIMGDSPGAAQSKAVFDLTTPSSRIWFLPDGNKLGERCATELFYDVGQHRFCTWLRLADGKPTDCSADELKAMLAWTIST